MSFGEDKFSSSDELSSSESEEVSLEKLLTEEAGELEKLLCGERLLKPLSASAVVEKGLIRGTAEVMESSSSSVWLVSTFMFTSVCCVETDMMPWDPGTTTWKSNLCENLSLSILLHFIHIINVRKDDLSVCMLLSIISFV